MKELKNMFGIMKKLVNIVVCHLLYHVQYENIQEINKYDKCLICPNHSNIFDPAFIFPKVDHLYIMAKAELFRNKMLAKVFMHYHTFPIKREKSDIIGVKYVLDLFHQNEKIKLLMFPEGGILKPNERRRKIKNGAVHIAVNLNIPIIPISITESPKLFHKVKVIVKEPIYIEQEALTNKEKLQEESQKLLTTIYE